MIRNSKYRTKKEVQEWSEEFAKTCRLRGIRLTDQRLTVYQVLAEDLSHPTAEVLFERVSKKMPSMSLATLYRTLEFLESENLIRRVSAPETIGRFDANLEPHQHLVCRKCGMLKDFKNDVFSRIEFPELEEFSVEELDIRIVGVCKNCS